LPPEQKVGGSNPLGRTKLIQQLALLLTFCPSDPTQNATMLYRNEIPTF
jgi:hypothetical protein